MVGKKWSNLTPAYRNRVSKSFPSLSKRQVRERYNRGTLGPLQAARGHARTPERPERAQRHPEIYREYIEKRQRIIGDKFPESKRVQALTNIRTSIAHYFKYKDSTVVANVNAMSGPELDWSIHASAESIRHRASVQVPGQARWWTDEERSNPWFYH